MQQPQQPELHVLLLHKDAQLPIRATPGSIGLDLYALEDCKMQYGHRSLVRTGISIEIVNNLSNCCYPKIAPRSGLSTKGIDIGAGIIDLDYRGEIKVLLINNNRNRTIYLDGPQYNSFQIKKGDRIAQLIIEGNPFIIMKQVDSLSSTERGNGGFGSTGNK